MNTPVKRADTFNLAAPGANTNILSTSITPVMDGWLAVHVVLATGSIFNVTETQSSTTFTVGLNKSNSLNAGDGYDFMIAVTAATAYNFQVETDGIIRRLVVHECYVGNAQPSQGT